MIFVPEIIIVKIEDVTQEEFILLLWRCDPGGVYFAPLQMWPRRSLFRSFEDVTQEEFILLLWRCDPGVYFSPVTYMSGGCDWRWFRFVLLCPICVMSGECCCLQSLYCPSDGSNATSLSYSSSMHRCTQVLWLKWNVTEMRLHHCWSSCALHLLACQVRFNCRWFRSLLFVSLMSFMR